MRRSAVVARRSPGQSQRTQRVLLAAGGSRGGGGRGRDAAGAYAEPARGRIEQLAALSSQAAARVFGRVRGQRRRSHPVRRGGRQFLPHAEQWTVHFFKWMRRAQVRGGRAPAHKSLRAALGTLGAGR